MIPRFDAGKLVAAAEGSLAHQAACQADARHHVLKSAVATLSGIEMIDMLRKRQLLGAHAAKLSTAEQFENIAGALATRRDDSGAPASGWKGLVSPAAIQSRMSDVGR